MTPEERAKKLMSEYERKDFNFPCTVEKDVASAIREAEQEAYARGLEMCARIAEREPSPTGPFIAEKIRERKEQP